MTLNELMIGDWFFNKNTGKYQQVHPHFFGQVSRQVNEKTDLDLGLWFNVFPIPITPEILEKNGWTYNDVDKVFYPAQLRGELPYIVGMNGVFRVRDFCEIRYVHELQHALRLCGIDKPIIL